MWLFQNAGLNLIAFEFLGSIFYSFILSFATAYLFVKFETKYMCHDGIAKSDNLLNHGYKINIKYIIRYILLALFLCLNNWVLYNTFVNINHSMISNQWFIVINSIAFIVSIILIIIKPTMDNKKAASILIPIIAADICALISLMNIGNCYFK